MIGSELAGFRILSELGTGAMGTVYLAEALRAGDGLEPGARVALKVVHPHLLQQPGFRQRFLAEAHIGRRVHSENVVNTITSQSARDGDAPVHFLVMEYVEGQTLRQLVDELVRVPEDLCRHIGVEVANGLSAIHEAGAVHRDIKPENVLITEARVVKVMDLGVARLQEEAERLSLAGSFVGSLEYASPEQFRSGNRDADGRSDQYALGVMLYELSTGEHPYRHEDASALIRSILDEAPRRIGELCPQVSAFFEEVVHQLLAKEADARFPTADAVATALGGGEAGEWWRERKRALEDASGAHPRRVRMPHESALYGRDEDIGRMTAAFDHARGGAGRVLLLEGEAGVGKTRLVEEFALRLQKTRRDANVLLGAYAPGAGGSTDGAFSSAFGEHLSGAGAARYLPQTPLLVPAFDALLRGDGPPPEAEPLTAGAVQTCFLHVTRALAADRPTAILIEDLHLASDNGRALFVALAASIREERVLLVGTTRPGLDASWVAEVTRLGHAHAEQLSRLDASQVKALLEEVFDSQHVAADLGARIAETSDGNPFFIFELLRSLREGADRIDPGRSTFATARRIADIEIPSSVLDLVKARVAALDEAERDLLDVAACIGFEFDPTLLSDVTDRDRIDTLRLLGRIERRHRLVRSRGRQFVFDHHQVRDVLENDLSDPLREAYHASLGDTLERQFLAGPRGDGPIPGQLAVELAGHFLVAGDGPRSRTYVEPALSHLEWRGRTEQAIRLSTRALDARGLFTGPPRARLLLRRVQHLGNAGDRAAQRHDLAEATQVISAAEDPLLAMQVASAMGRVALGESRIDEAREHFRHSLSLAREVGDQRGVIAATGNLGVVLQTEGHLDEAREFMERTLALAREHKEPAFEAAATGNLGNIHQIRGELEAAKQHHRRNLELVQVHANSAGEAAAWGNLAAVLRLEGRIGEARTCAENQLTLVRQLGDRAGEALARCNLGSIAKAEGRLAEAHACLDHSLGIAREIEERRSATLAMANLAAVLVSEGHVAEGRRTAEEAQAMAREAGDTRSGTLVAVTLADILRCEGRMGDARESATRALAMAREVGDRVGEIYALRSLGETLRVEGAFEDARHRLQEALTGAQDSGIGGVRALAAAGLALLPGGDLERAERVVEEEAAHLTSEEGIEAHFLLWCATLSAAHLEAANWELDALVIEAPEDARETMIENVPMHAQIRAADRGAEGGGAAS